MQYQIVPVFLTVVIIHIFCQSEEVVAQCRNIYGKGLSRGDIQIILNGHNNLRNDIAQGKYISRGLPKGKNFKELIWDNKLAQAAQRVADTCVFGHQKIKDAKGVTETHFHVTLGRWRAVGQNLHIVKSTANKQGADWKEALKAWMGEYEQYQFGQKINKKNGHLTQMIWADTKFIGCGFTNFLSDDPKFKYKKLYVCNYGPGGNYARQQPYRT